MNEHAKAEDGATLSRRGSEGSRRHDDLRDRPGYLVRRLHQIHVGLFAEEFADCKLTPVQYAMLSILSARTGIDQLSLSKAVGVDRTSGADVIKRLVREKLVMRTTSPDDRRMKLVSITPAGADLACQMRPAMDAAQDRLMSPLSPDEREAFMDTLHRMIEANNGASRAPMS
ncbi:MarR family winged helix-turn-helix transcriptional regulator [Aquicoccus sp. G2-2]|uniref:MarR family winged helix-turn-helix transcriptional regulator n=1 Tax=Aquicoccus sp. G2-2 TaxID=3092120 RepID=UPI002AE08DC3|nr:MarR family transcriptional regulator [Aquicoccus sp. G2-2]MEA1113926.1 MarR family transcriptional regulator [Aquicoccus sp. G2-2]